MDTEDKKVYLCFINLVGKEEDGKYRYEFIFTDNPDECWSEGWNEKPAALINDLNVDEQYKTETHVIKTTIKLDLLQNNGCFSYSDATDGIVAIGWENIDEYDEYPQDGRIFFMFGESFDDVERKLAMKNILFSN
jgi:hypothetical protein